MSFSSLDRQQNLKRFENEVFDLAIVGGGITGAGIARDAASRGMKVALLEAKDYAHGTSSRSSKLIHGGIRYLENFEFHLVFEALSERSLLFEMAPHLVHPLRFVIPIYKSSRVPYWKMSMGMWLYDILSLFEAPEMHVGLGSTEMKNLFPDLNGGELVGGFEYSDAYMDDDRLVIETLRSAHQKGAALCNYTEVTSVEKSGERIEKLHFVDKCSGEKGGVRAKQVMASVGPWTDIFGKHIYESWKNRLRPTKGVHITFHRDRLPLEKAVVMAVEKRIIFVIPRNEMVIVGTTDTDFKEDPINVSCDREDVDYLLAALNKYFPGLELKEKDIVASYSGVRPLVDDDSDSEGKTSREHAIFSTGPNLTFIAGGKYTTYRKMSEDAVDKVLDLMDFDEKMKFGKANTKEPLNPLATLASLDQFRLMADEFCKQYEVSEEVYHQLVERHGGECERLLPYFTEFGDLIDEETKMWMAEAIFAIENTCCVSLEDFYWRRTPLFLSHKDHGLKFLSSISSMFAQFFKWNDAEKKQQENNLVKAIEQELAWKN